MDHWLSVAVLRENWITGSLASERGSVRVKRATGDDHASASETQHRYFSTGQSQIPPAEKQKVVKSIAKSILANALALFKKFVALPGYRSIFVKMLRRIETVVKNPEINSKASRNRFNEVSKIAGARAYERRRRNCRVSLKRIREDTLAAYRLFAKEPLIAS